MEITPGFLLLMAWLNYADLQGVLPLALTACALHEAGHWWAIRLLGGGVKLIRLSAVGAEMVLGRSLSYCREAAAAGAGPAVNLAAAALSCRLGTQEGNLFAGVNLALGCFNLLPAGALDGGRICRCLAALWLGPERSDRLLDALDGLLAGALLTAGCALALGGGSFTLLLAGGWVAAAAQKIPVPSGRKKGLPRGAGAGKMSPKRMRAGGMR